MSRDEIHPYLDLSNFLYRLRYPDDHKSVRKGIEDLERILTGEVPVDKTKLNKLTRMFFKSGKGAYTGIESRLPSEFIDVYPLWLKLHAKYNEDLIDDEKKRGRRILIVKYRAELHNDKLKNYKNFIAFANWHRETGIGLSFIEQKVAEKIRKKHKISCRDVAIWEKSYAVTFLHNKEGVRINAIENSQDVFEKIKEYVKEITETAEPLDPNELILIPAPLAQNWKGYTGTAKERERIHSFISNQLTEFQNKRGIVLDAAAGIGNEALYLIKNGFFVLINEIDPNFSSILQKNIEEDAEIKANGFTIEQLEPRIFHKDWSELHDKIAPESLSAILVLGNSLCMVMNDDGKQQRMKCIEEFFKLLCPGGILIIDERNFPKILTDLASGETVKGQCVMYPGKEIECIIRHTENSHKLRFDFIRDGELIGDIPVSCLEKDELKNMLIQVGFKKIKVFSDLISKRALDSRAKLFTYVASKPSGRKRSIKKSPTYIKKKTKKALDFITIGSDEGEIEQWGVIGKSGKKPVRFDLNAPHIICVCGKMGSGKGYTIGVLCEMLISNSIQKLSKIVKKATIIVLHNPEEDKRSEFWSMSLPNDVEKEVNKLSKEYKMKPQSIISNKNIRIFVDPLISSDKADEIKTDYNVDSVYPIQVNPSTLTGKELATILSSGAITDHEYVQTLFSIIQNIKTFDMNKIKSKVTSNGFLTPPQKRLAQQRLGILEECIAETKDKDFFNKIALGGVNIFDFRKTLRRPEDIFSIMTLLLGVLQTKDGLDEPFVFVINEAHTYFKNGISGDFVNNIRYLIRRKRSGANWLLLDTHLAEDLDEKVMKLADVRIMHFMSKDMISEKLKLICGKDASRLSELEVGQCLVVADKSSKGKGSPILVDIRPRLTKHGAPTKTAAK